MLVTREYNRENARAYAERWAFARNPLYYNYAGIGGNCTNFVSQCLYAGSCRMNYTPIYGWYYLSPAARTAAWTGVEYLYNFLTGNTSVGPFAEETDADALEIGDVVQLGREEAGYYHTLLVVGRAEDGDILLAANSEDAYRRPLSAYTYDFARFLHILGVRLEMPDTADCFTSLIEGIAILPDLSSLPPLEPTPPAPAPMPEPTPEEPPVPEEDAIPVFLPSENPARGPA